VTTLVNSNDNSKNKKGRSKRAQVLVNCLSLAIENFITKSEDIEPTDLDLKEKLYNKIENLKTIKNVMIKN